ncbi:zinc finger RING FYVE PHD-type [Fusarium beomiforme]|uniref:Zinc finger RING FYVE PHD-type n=1 Tax=Fusarium beomiforme TaxID=44412 RepID=A0A9P5A6K4_9HYPO|nr:zinc finger RING FYVE PHD-type [Fusarium beomiforme]
MITEADHSMTTPPKGLKGIFSWCKRFSSNHEILQEDVSVRSRPPSSVAEGNENKERKCLFRRISSKRTKRLVREKGEKRFVVIHNFRKLRIGHQRGPSDPSGFTVLERRDPMARDPKVLHPDLSPNHCVMCGKQLHDSASNFKRWRNCEARVYLPCGHWFGHHCLHNHLKSFIIPRTPTSDAVVATGELHCPMGNCIPIQYECGHLAIPTLKPHPHQPESIRQEERQEGQEEQGEQANRIILSECNFCSSGAHSKLMSRLQKHGKKMLVLPSPREHTRIPDRVTSRVKKAKRSWHKRRFQRHSRALDDKWLKSLEKKFQECEARRLAWLGIVIEPPANMALEETNRQRRSIDAPEIVSPPSQQENSKLSSGPSTEMLENPNLAEARKQKAVESTTSVKNVSSPDENSPAVASESWKLPQVPKQPSITVGCISTEADKSAARSEKEVIFPDPPKDEPKVT